MIITIIMRSKNDELKIEAHEEPITDFIIDRHRLTYIREGEDDGPTIDLHEVESVLITDEKG